MKDFLMLSKLYYNLLEPWCFRKYTFTDCIKTKKKLRTEEKKLTQSKSPIQKKVHDNTGIVLDGIEEAGLRLRR